MKHYLISEEQSEAYTKFLSAKDCEMIAAKTKYSLSTVNNILYRRTRVNEDTEKVVEAFNRLCEVRVQEAQKEADRVGAALKQGLFNPKPE